VQTLSGTDSAVQRDALRGGGASIDASSSGIASVTVSGLLLPRP
jgi:hypothetical protein